MCGIVGYVGHNMAHPYLIDGLKKLQYRGYDSAGIGLHLGNYIVHEIIAPMLSVVPLQLLAYYVGIERGLNVDQPRNLAKSVTVE